MRRKRAELSAFFIACGLCAPAVQPLAADRLFAQADCAPKESALDLECRVTLTEGSARKPVREDIVVVTADMPSMPGMHAARPARAAATAETGVFLVRLKLDMGGRWAFKIRVGDPPRGETVAIVEVKNAPR